MTDSEMASAILWGVIGWTLLVAFCLGLIFVLARRPKGQGAPKYRPDPAFDPAVREDREVEALDVLWDLPAFDPRHTW